MAVAGLPGDIFRKALPGRPVTIGRKMKIFTCEINAVDKILMDRDSMGRRRTLTTKAPAVSMMCRDGISVCKGTKHSGRLKG